jgi:hypothetical protein
MYHDATRPASPAIVQAAREAVARRAGREALAETDRLVESGHFAWMTVRGRTDSAALQPVGPAALDVGPAAAVVQFDTADRVFLNTSWEYWARVRRLVARAANPAPVGKPRWRR